MCVFVRERRERAKMTGREEDVFDEVDSDEY